MEELLRVEDLGEQGLLKILQGFCPADRVGDDGALLEVSSGQSLVVTTDVLVDGIHFSDQTTQPFDVGWRAAAANLSDLAAMGAVPLGITVGLSLPGTLTVVWVEQLYQGMVACLQSTPLRPAPIVGGDICRSPVITVAIAAFGQVSAQQAIRRSTARPGDVILVTGAHGASRAGLELLLHPDQGLTLSAALRATLIQAHQRPTPRLDVIPLLQASWEAAPQPFCLTGMDSSDGLADAVLQLCRASRVGARLDRAAIPVPAGLTDWVSEAQALDWAFYGGEDFELVLCLPEAIAQGLLPQLGPGAAVIGRITDQPGVIVGDRSGSFPEMELSLGQGFQHFGTPSASA